MAALAAACLLAATGCASPPNTVNIHNLKFDPATLTVPAGTTVTWVNNDLTAHIVRTNDFGVEGKSQTGQFSSEPLNPGETYTHTFDTPGTYDFTDPLQGYISSEVVVK